MGGLCSGFYQDYRKACCAARYKQAWQVGFDHSRRLKSFQGVEIDRRQGDLYEEVPEQGKPYKVKAFSICVLNFGSMIPGKLMASKADFP